MTRNAIKRVLVGLIIVAMVAQPIAPIVGSAAATSTSTDAPTDPAATGPGSDLLLETDNTTDDNTTDSFDEPTSIWGTGPDAARIVFGAASGYLFEAEKIESISNQERRNEMYHKLETQHESTESLMSLYNNYVHDSRMVADAKARAEVADAYRDGFSESTARQKANAAIEKYYSRMLKGALERYEAHLQQVKYVSNITDEDPDIRRDFIHPEKRTVNTNSDWNLLINESYIVGYESINMTLPNGTVVNYDAPEVHYNLWSISSTGTTDNYGEGTQVFDPADGKSEYTLNTVGMNDGYYEYYFKKVFQTYYSNNDDTLVVNEVYDAGSWYDVSSEIKNSSQYMSNNINDTVDEVWTALERDQIQSGDLVDPTLAWEDRAGTSVDNMSDYSLSLFTLSNLGINTADLNQTRKQVIHYRGLPAEAPRHEGETIAYSNVSGTSTTLPTEIDTGVNLTASDNAVYEVRVVYDDNSTALVPRSEFIVPDYESPDNTQTNVSIKDWSAPNVNKTVSHVSVRVLTNLTNPETATLWHNETVTGMLASGEMPEDGKFLVNKTYHTAQVPGVQQIAVLDENGTLMETRGQITILSAYDAAGTEVENISWSEHDYATYDGGDIQNVTDRMIELQNQLIELEEDLESGGGGGGTDDGGSIDLNLPSFDLGELWGIPIWLIIALVIAAVLIAGS